MRLARLEGGAQRLARPQQVLLPNDVIQRARTEPFRERRGR
jgi:hypothetical protein